MTSTDAPEGVAVLTNRFGVTGKTARKSASFALNVTGGGVVLPHPASLPEASAASARARTAPVLLVMAGRLRQFARRTPAPAQEIGARHPPATFGLDLLEGESAVAGRHHQRPAGTAGKRSRCPAPGLPGDPCPPHLEAAAVEGGPGPRPGAEGTHAIDDRQPRLAQV